MNTKELQSYMAQQRIDGWLIHDFRGSNAVFARMLGGKKWTTRRCDLFIPATGEPTLLCHGIDASTLEAAAAGIGARLVKYLSWSQMHDELRCLLSGRDRIAMEYAPGCTLPVVGTVDAGTVELIRSFGAQVVSSANLIQISIAIWSKDAVAKHQIAADKVNQIKDEAFRFIGDKLKAGAKVLEHEAQAFIMSRFKAEGLETPDEPIVAANAHSGDPHYAPGADHPHEIKKGDWVLIDLWARVPGDENIYADITWVGFAGETPSERHRAVFETVKAARDAAVDAARAAFAAKQPIQGWQLDDAAMKPIIDGGYKEFIRHRTGHSLSPGAMVHGVGVNLDNLETHDTREVLPGVGYTIEPGIYTPEFGVRLEINVYQDPAKGPVITSQVQKDIIRIC